METKEIISLLIVPAYFIRYEKNTPILACCMGETEQGQSIIQEKAFPSILLEGIKNPTKLFISKEIRPGMLTVACLCGKHYRKPFTWVKDYVKR